MNRITVTIDMSELNKAGSNSVVIFDGTTWKLTSLNKITKDMTNKIKSLENQVNNQNVIIDKMNKQIASFKKALVHYGFTIAKEGDKNV